MAQRRMLSKKVIETDKFLEMPLTTQALYMHLVLQTDDDGFVDNATSICRMIGASKDDLQLLAAKEFIIPFSNGLIVIRDWRIHNYIKSDRYHKTLHTAEYGQLSLTDSGSYTVGSDMEPERTQNVSTLEPERNRYVSEVAPEVRLGKVRLGKDNNNNNRTEEQKTVVVDGEQENVTTSSEVRKLTSGAQTEVTQYWEANGFGTLSPKTRDDLRMWIHDFTNAGATEPNAVAILEKAMDTAIDNNARRYNYVNSILTNWQNKQLITVEAVNADAASWHAKNKQTNANSSNAWHSENTDWDKQPELPFGG